VVQTRAEAREAKVLARKAGDVAANKARLDAEMRAAGENAAKLCSSAGMNFNAAIKMGPFDLPHPAGRGNILENVQFSLTPGRRYALIGRNGKGKSTLLRHIAARHVSGLPAAARVEYVSQDVSFTASQLEKMPGEVVAEADVERRVLMERLEALRGADEVNTEEQQACLDQLDAIDADSADARAEQMLSNLGFSAELRSRSVKALSGGWRVRVALAAALFAKPDMLMLDEPTNHLSMQAVLWLSRELSHNRLWRDRIILTTSHDRCFIDDTCTDVLHISGVARTLTHVRCNYTDWERAQREQRQARQQRIKVRGSEIAKLQRYVASGQAAAGNTSSTTRRLQLQKLKNEAEAEAQQLAFLSEDVDLPLTIHGAGSLDRPAVELQDVAFAYAGAQPLFCSAGKHPYEFVVRCNSRIVLMGENGNGKSTLVKLLLGELEPTQGAVVRNRNARFALVNQHHADQFDLKLSPMELMKRKFAGNQSDSWVRSLGSHLMQCGIEDGLLDVPAMALSGGQRTRLAMAMVSYERPHVLIMDEPTNNLDLASVEALAEAVERFDGGVVLVSHDQRFVQRVAHEVWVVADGAVQPVAAGFEEYHAKLLAQIAAGSSKAAEALEAYLQKKLLLSGGRISRQTLAEEAKALR
jgi:ATP-binding cassette subfamily F protein 3